MPLSDFRSVSPESLRLWTDPRVVALGEGYLSRVSDIRETETGTLLASVTGTDKYATEVWFDKAGDLQSRCTCPAKPRCKHGVALALRCARAAREGESLTAADPNDPRLSVLADAEKKALARAEAASGKQKQRDMAAERERKEREDRETAAENAFRKRKAFFEAARDRLRALRDAADLEGTLKTVDETLSATDDDFHIDSRGVELFGALDAALAPAVETIRESAMPDAEKNPLVARRGDALSILHRRLAGFLGVLASRGKRDDLFPGCMERGRGDASRTARRRGVRRVRRIPRACPPRRWRMRGVLAGRTRRGGVCSPAKVRGKDRELAGMRGRPVPPRPARGCQVVPA